MKWTWLAALLAGACLGCSASSYNMPENERSRVCAADEATVWNAALDALSDCKCTLLVDDRERGYFDAHVSSPMFDTRGFNLHVVIRKTNGGVKLTANVEARGVSGDWGRSKRIVQDYLASLDRRLR